MRRKRSKQERHGLIVVLSAMMLIMLFGFVAFAIDVGYIVGARTELQRTADACAMAAAMRLSDQADAIAEAKLVALDNLGMVGPALQDANIEFGEWDRDTATFTTPAPGGNQPNAVRVTLERTQASGNPLTLFFAPMLNNRTADASATATAMADQSLCGPFVGIDWLSVPGSPRTDSYDASAGSYNHGLASDRGSICSDGPINVDGSAYVRGDAQAGKGYDVAITGSATVTGDTGSRLKPLNMPPVDASDAAANNNNANIPQIPQGNGWRSVVDANGNFLLDGNRTLNLPGGTYYLNDFTLSGQATLNIRGPVTLYLTGNFSRAGGVDVNFNTQLASNFQVYMTGGTASITSNNDFYGVIYGPNTDITLDGSSDLYGAVVGRTLTITGSGRAHFDESLGLSGVDLPTRSALVE